MKNLYQILGVLDDAEDIIIRAAYKALAQKYHPDKWKGDANDANRRMSEINEAYGVLSNSEKRAQYDSEYFKYHQKNEAQEEDAEHSNFISEDDEAWNIAIEFYPQLQKDYLALARISNILGNTFKAKLIEEKKFEEANVYRETLECEYLERYYGRDKEIQDFAKRLLLNNFKKEAIHVNKIIRAMGDSIDYGKLFKRMVEIYPKLKDHPEFFDTDGLDLILKSIYQNVYNEEGLMKLYLRFFKRQLTLRKKFLSVKYIDGNREFDELQVRNAIEAKIKNDYYFKE